MTLTLGELGDDDASVLRNVAVGLVRRSEVNRAQPRVLRTPHQSPVTNHESEIGTSVSRRDTSENDNNKTKTKTNTL